MKVIFHELTIPLKNAFTISRDTLTEQQLLIVELQQDGVSGYGEVTASSFYGHSLEQIKTSIRQVMPVLDALVIDAGSTVWEAVSQQLAGDTFALSALDIASHDLAGKLQGKPCYKMWGLDWTNVPKSSVTIGIDLPEKMVATLQSLPGWDVYKIKLGTADDLAIIHQLRQHTSATFRVDANCAWDADQTIDYSHQLKELEVELIEQPMARDLPRPQYERVYSESVLPIIADESCCVEADVEKCVGAFHGINVKLCKCGGLTPAVRMLQQARSLNLHTMVGCMVETSIGISAAAQLLPLLDFADLDGALLLGNDPADGVRVDCEQVCLTERAGCGAVLKSQSTG